MSQLQLDISIPNSKQLDEAVDLLAKADESERGAVFTRFEVVEFILDLVGYSETENLVDTCLLEPSFGSGDFLIPAIKRLLNVWKKDSKRDADELVGRIKAVELNKETFNETRVKISDLLLENGIDENSSQAILDSWLVNGDFLLTPMEDDFEFIVGNPPYLRQELIPKTLLAEYRSRYKTLYDRADIYVPFIERSLELLKVNGKLGFICADRWTKNRYGEPLRKMVSEGFNLNVYVDMVDTDAFKSEVSAYPAITIIERSQPGKTKFFKQPEIDTKTLRSLAQKLTSPKIATGQFEIQENSGVVDGGAPWILGSFDKLNLVRKLEDKFPLIEDTGCKVGIGVATGADKIFIGPYEELDVEAERKLPLAMTKDIVSGTVDWQGNGVINPFGKDGQLVDLNSFPKLNLFFEKHRELLQKRHVAQKSSKNWYRTIDKINPELCRREKLLIPDIKGDAHIVFEKGSLYPHHNLYYIISDSWDLRALQAVLTSGLARLFVSIYSTKMRGGFLRFQAQYLRRIRLPFWSDVSDDIGIRLKEAAVGGEIKDCLDATASLLSLTKDERNLLS